MDQPGCYARTLIFSVNLFWNARSGSFMEMYSVFIFKTCMSSYSVVVDVCCLELCK